MTQEETDLLVAKGKFVVFKPLDNFMSNFDDNSAVIFWIHDTFPIDDFKFFIMQNKIEAREATQLEKEYCFAMMEKFSQSDGACLEGFEFWKKEKNAKMLT